MKIRFGLLQMNSQEDVMKNARDVLSFIQSLPSQDLYVAPENSLYCGRTHSLFAAAKQIKKEALPWLRAQFNKMNLKIPVVLGGVPIQKTRSKGVNQWWVFQDGKWKGGYIKRKLFKAHVPGSRSYDEGLNFIPGKKGQILKLGSRPHAWKLGATICYDLRFPELFQDYASQGSHVCAVPSAFTQKTGEAHWHVLLRARAIENKMFIVAPAQVGKAPGDREAFGHSLVVDPWGRVLLDASDKVGAFSVECDLNEVARVRTLIG